MNKLTTRNLSVLYVEDDVIARENGIEYLENYFTAVYEASDAIAALKLYETHKPDIIITDIQMPRLNGLEFVKRVRQKDKKTQIIIVTAFSDEAYLLKAVELKLVKYLIKPVKEEALEEALELCIESINEEYSNIEKLSEHAYFDRFNQTLVVDNKVVKLRTKELALFALLLKYKHRYVTYTEIENTLWHESVMTKDALKTLVKTLKAKLPKGLITNLTGTGYKLEF